MNVAALAGPWGLSSVNAHELASRFGPQFAAGLVAPALQQHEQQFPFSFSSLQSMLPAQFGVAPVGLGGPIPGQLGFRQVCISLALALAFIWSTAVKGLAY